MLSTGEIAEILKISDKTVRNMIEAGEIPGYRIGNQYRVKVEDFNEYLEKSRIKNESQEA